MAMLGGRRGLTCGSCIHMSPRVSSAAVLYCSKTLESLPVIYRLHHMCHMHLSHRIVESWRLERTSRDCLVQNPCLKAGSPRAGCSGACFVTLTVKKEVFLCLSEISSISVCACCLLSVPWIPRVFLTASHQVFVHIDKPL